MKELLFTPHAFCLVAAAIPCIKAYIDPSVMTYTIQIVAGVIVAVGAVIGIYWRRAKKKVQDKLGIDENANKEVEADITEIEEKPTAVSADTEK